MNDQKCPQNFIPGLTAPQEHSDSSSTINKEHVKESSPAQKLFVRAGLIGLLIPAPKVIDESAKKLLHENFDIKRQSRITRSHTIDVPSETLANATEALDSRRATFGHIHTNESDNEMQKRERTVKDLKKAHKLLSNNRLLVRGPSAYGKRKVGVQENVTMTPKEERRFHKNGIEEITTKESKSLEKSKESMNQSLTSSSKRRSRSFSSGINYLCEKEGDDRPSSTDLTKPSKRKGKSFCTAEKTNNNDERKTMTEMQEVLRSKLPKTFQATASIGLIGPAALCEKRKYSHVKSSPKNSSTLSPLRDRVNSFSKLKNFKSELTKQQKLSSSDENMSKTAAVSKEHATKHKRGNFKLFSKKSKSLSLDHAKDDETEDQYTVSKGVVTSHMVYIPRSASLPQQEELNKKSTSPGDRLSSSSNDSGINFNVLEDDSSEEEPKKITRQSQRSFKHIYLTPTPQQKSTMPSDEPNQHIKVSPLSDNSNDKTRKVSVGLRKISIGKPPAVHRVSLKISQKVSLIKLASPTEKNEAKFFSLPKRPHSYLRGIREDILKDIDRNYSNTLTLPTGRHQRTALSADLFRQNTAIDGTS